jgi:hypothetical protein
MRTQEGRTVLHIAANGGQTAVPARLQNERLCAASLMLVICFGCAGLCQKVINYLLEKYSDRIDVMAPRAHVSNSCLFLEFAVDAKFDLICGSVVCLIAGRVASVARGRLQRAH